MPVVHPVIAGDLPLRADSDQTVMETRQRGMNWSRRHQLIQNILIRFHRIRGQLALRYFQHDYNGTPLLTRGQHHEHKRSQIRPALDLREPTRRSG